MATWKLSDLSKKMKKLDICMLATVDGDGHINARPMSNNGEVEYDGNSFFFSDDHAGVVKEIEENRNVSLAFNHKDLYITMIAEAELVEDKQEMQEHWTDDLEKWFPEGVNTAGIVLIRVAASKIRYWENEEQGEIVVREAQKVL
jgi:general stress protein 26